MSHSVYILHTYFNCFDIYRRQYRDLFDVVILRYIVLGISSLISSPPRHDNDCRNRGRAASLFRAAEFRTRNQGGEGGILISPAYFTCPRAARLDDSPPRGKIKIGINQARLPAAAARAFPAESRAIRG